MAHLRLFRGNQPYRVELTESRYVLGRSPTCDIVLDSDAVSRRHAQIQQRGELYVLEDLGSRNKTYLNGSLVSGPIELDDNDIIRICNYHILFLIDSTTDSSKYHVIAKGGGEDSTQIKVVHAATTEGSDPGLDDQTRAREKLEAILEINLASSQVYRSETLIGRVLDTLLRIFPQADRCYFLMRENATGETKLRASRNRHGPPDTPPRFSQTILHRVFEEGQALLAEDALQDPILAQNASVMANLIHSILCVPLFGDSAAPNGAIWLHTENANRPFLEADLDVLLSVATVVGLGLERARMHEQLLEHDRRTGESEVGRIMQEIFLPPDWPTMPGYQFYANCRPAYVVGGDYFGFMQLPGDRFAVALGDVSGNGMAAALLMARLSSEVRFAAISNPNPAAALESLNRLLHTAWPQDRFVTLVYGELNRTNHTLGLVNAGHIPPLLRRSNSEVVPLTGMHSGPPLNAAENPNYQEVTIPLLPDELVLFYTDGLVDARNSRAERFGQERLQRILSASPIDPGHAGNLILQAVDRFRDGTPQSDDIALVCFGRKFN